MGFGSTVWIHNHTSTDANRAEKVKELLAQKGMKCLLLTQQRSGNNCTLPHKGGVQKLCFSGSGFSPENHSLFQFKQTAKCEWVREKGPGCCLESKPAPRDKREQLPTEKGRCLSHLQTLLSLCTTWSGFLSSIWAPWGRETAERGCFSLLMLILGEELPPCSCCSPSSLTPLSQVWWGMSSEDLWQNVCHRACVWVCAMEHFPSCQATRHLKAPWAHLLKKLPLSSVLSPCCGQEKGYTNSLEASRDRRIRDTTSLNFLRIHSSGASPTPQVYYRNRELFTDITVSWIWSLASLLLELIQFIKVQFTRGSSLNWDESHGTSLSPLLFFPLRGMPSKCLTWSP